MRAFCLFLHSGFRYGVATVNAFGCFYSKRRERGRAFCLVFTYIDGAFGYGVSIVNAIGHVRG